ncbi:hypothetical protein AURDEDRAFT_114774 [Auricularia subglabra TFB-10046 SS5]|nr:hypothetical protein AURDEDRAFT_114774 [Auricularia subglabra TFB-10046 SS5]
MRSLVVVALIAAAAVVGAQDAEYITPMVPSATDESEWITPLVTGNADEITPLVTPTPVKEAAITTTFCVSAAATVTPGVASSSIDPHNAPDGWACFESFEQGGGVWTVPLSAASSKHNNRVTQLIVPIVVSIVAALALLGVGMFVVRRRAKRAHKEAASRPWFTRQGWVTGSSPTVAQISKPEPAMIQANIV